MQKPSLSPPTEASASPKHSKKWCLSSEEETQLLAQNLANILSTYAPEDLPHINLDGNLGAGKTTFARYLLQALGVKGRIKSPSYSIAEHYTPQPNRLLLHFDFYRFNDPMEWEDAGFRELFTQAALKLVEWADKAHPMLPQADLVFTITIQDTVRHCTATAYTSKGKKTLDVWK